MFFLAIGFEVFTVLVALFVLFAGMMSDNVMKGNELQGKSLAIFIAGSIFAASLVIRL